MALDMSSPFTILPEDLSALCASHGFAILRNYLAEHEEYGFCAEHASCNDETRETFLLHRDVLHALLMPIVQLFSRASEIAAAALCSQRPEDLELAFSGEARSAFLWMQCFLHDEEEWCRSLACPACIVTQTLSTESTIRMTMTASLLSKADYDVASPNTQAALPSFAFFLPSLKHATSSDPFWGPEYTSFLLQRAENLESGLQTLIAQLGELEALVTSPTTSPKRVSTQPLLQKEAVQGTKIRKSRLAKRQLRLYWEEQAMLKRLAEQAWGAVVLKDTTTMEQRAFLRAVARGKPGFGRRRSLTCP